MNRHGSSFGSNNCSKMVVNSVFSHFCKRWVLAQKGVAPIFAHPRFGPQKKPVFCLRSKVLGMLPTCFFVFFYIDFVFFFMIFAYFPIFFVKFSACANANWQISGVICCVSDDHLMQISHNFPTCTIEITQHTLLYGWNYTIHPPVLLKLPNTPFCMVEITQHALLSGWNYPAHPPVRLKLSSTPWRGRSS